MAFNNSGTSECCACCLRRPLYSDLNSKNYESSPTHTPRKPTVPYTSQRVFNVGKLNVLPRRNLRRNTIWTSMAAPATRLHTCEIWFNSVSWTTRCTLFGNLHSKRSNGCSPSLDSCSILTRLSCASCNTSEFQKRQFLKTNCYLFFALS